MVRARDLGQGVGAVCRAYLHARHLRRGRAPQNAGKRYTRELAHLVVAATASDLVARPTMPFSPPFPAPRRTSTCGSPSARMSTSTTAVICASDSSKT